MNQDKEQLNLLSIFYYIYSGLIFLVSIAFFGMSVFFRFISKLPQPQNTQYQPGPPPEFMVGIMSTFYIIVGILLIVVAILNLLAAPKIKKCESRTFCMVVAGIDCLKIPLGTALGVFTFIVLGRPSVIAMFEGRTYNPPPTQYQ